MKKSNHLTVIESVVNFINDNFKSFEIGKTVDAMETDLLRNLSHAKASWFHVHMPEHDMSFPIAEKTNADDNTGEWDVIIRNDKRPDLMFSLHEYQNALKMQDKDFNIHLVSSLPDIHTRYKNALELRVFLRVMLISAGMKSDRIHALQAYDELNNYIFDMKLEFASMERTV